MSKTIQLSNYYYNKTYIDNNFVKTSDIKDNLTSTDTNKPLSAKQGKLLNEKFDNYLTTSSASNTYVAKESGKGLFSGSYTDLTNKPIIPSDISDLTDLSNTSFTPKSHTHGNLQNNGQIIVAGDIRSSQNVVTTANGYITTEAKPNMDNKVDKIAGKGLSTNDFTDTLKDKLDHIQWIVYSDMDLINMSFNIHDPIREMYAHNTNEEFFLEMFECETLVELIEQKCNSSNGLHIDWDENNLIFIKFQVPYAWNGITEDRYFIVHNNNDKNEDIHCAEIPLDAHYLKDNFNTPFTPKSHTHGNLKNDGQVGATAQANYNVVTDANGKITTEAKPTIPSKTSDLTNDGDGTNVFIKNNDSRLSNARTPTSHTHTISNITDFPSIPTKISDLTNDSGFITKTKHYYGTCSTGQSTQIKIVFTDNNFQFEEGVILTVKFTNAQTYNANSTDPLKIRINSDTTNIKDVVGADSSYNLRYCWTTNEVVSFVYDGTNFILSDAGIASTTYYGVTKLSDSISSTSTELAATPSAVKQAYDLANNHNQATSTITNNTAFNNILSGESTTLTLNTQAKINNAINTKIGELSSIQAIKVVDSKPTASADTMNKLYIVSENSKVNVYYTRQTGSGSSTTYAWSKMDTDILDELSIDWSSIQNKPSFGNTANTFCEGNDSRLSDARTPTSHSHTISDVTNFPALSTVATSGNYNDLSNRPTIPSASTTTPKSDTDNGAIGTGTTWAKADHQHPLSNAYATSSHTHNLNALGKYSSAGYAILSDNGQTDIRMLNDKLVYDINSDTICYDATGSHPIELATVNDIPTIPTIPTKVSDLTNDSGFITNTKHYYGTCSTGQNTQQKIVMTDANFQFVEGTVLTVKFTNAQHYNADSTNPLKIRINSDTANIKEVVGAGSSYDLRYCWSAGEVVSFVYDGTNFVLSDNGLASTTYYGITKLSSSISDTSTTTAATPSAVKQAYDLANGKANANHTHTSSNITDMTTANIVVTYFDGTTETLTLFKQQQNE